MVLILPENQGDEAQGVNGIPMNQARSSTVSPCRRRGPGPDNSQSEQGLPVHAKPFIGLVRRDGVAVAGHPLQVAVEGLGVLDAQKPAQAACQLGVAEDLATRQAVRQRHEGQTLAQADQIRFRVIEQQRHGAKMQRPGRGGPPSALMALVDSL